MAYVWVVEVRVRSMLSSGRLGGWTQWGPMEDQCVPSTPMAFNRRGDAVHALREFGASFQTEHIRGERRLRRYGRVEP